MSPRPRPAQERFERLFVPEPNSGCWIWAGGVDKSGYGCFRGINSEKIMAHRFAYGLVPDGLEINHKCRVKSCVNPDHLEVVTHTKNMGENKGLCHKGHRFDPAKDRCPECNRAWQRNRYRRINHAKL